MFLLSPFLNKEDTKKTYTNMFCISPFLRFLSPFNFCSSNLIFLSKVDKRVAIPGKYVNEIHGDKYTEDEDVDSDYERSIIVKI